MPTFTPIEMPTPLPVNQKTFDLSYQEDVSPVGYGFLQTIERAPPMWVASFQTPPLLANREQTFQSFLDQLEGSVGTFLGFDPRRPRPYAYRRELGYGVNSDPWAATPGVPIQCTGVDHANRTLTLDLFASGAVLTSGDYIAFKRDNIWFLHRVFGGPYEASDGGMTVSVSPRPRDSATSVACRLVRPCAAMKIVGPVGKQDKVDDIGPVYSFNAVQYIDRSGGT